MGQVLTVTNDAGDVIRYVYNLNGDLIEIHHPNGGVTRNIYDRSRRLIAEIDPLGNRTSFGHNARGNVNRGIDAEGKVLFIEYDLAGHKIRETDHIRKRNKLDKRWKKPCSTNNRSRWKHYNIRI